jgi:hypothetical protein
MLEQKGLTNPFSCGYYSCNFESEEILKNHLKDKHNIMDLDQLIIELNKV